ncbi:M13 family metallopeptidase [uncultured Duncaniella sp.]|uniref:M13 family metallopeptidase n=1 Tax=uncultured Duncaniella sp. TaxID=2768039 RepID=UPI0025B1FE4E|nr:M13 family metallopeptidase [uncultured Duncaniella sp.]
MTIAAAGAVAGGCTPKGSALKSLDTTSIDETIAVGEDFYGHVNKGWQQAHPLTAEHARYGQFNVLDEQNQERVKEIVTTLAETNPQAGSVAFKVSTIYNQAMDTVRRNNEGASPILADLRKIEESAEDDNAMTDLFMWMHSEHGSPFFNAGPMEDFDDSNAYAMYVSGGGIGLGNRDYYLLDDERNTAIRNAYRTLIRQQMINAGYSAGDAERIMENVMKIETSLAEETWSLEESRNIAAMKNPRSFTELKKMYPVIDWDRFFVETMGIDSLDKVIVTEINTVKRANDLLASLSPREKKDYYLWKYVAQAAPYLSTDFTDTSFEFSKVMSGVEEQRPLWKRALSMTESAMGEAIGELYVAKYFPESSKQKMLDLVENLRGALGTHIDNLTWMSDSTKANARKKLAAFTVKIGYPDKWKDYSTLEIDESKSLYDNFKQVQKWNKDDILSKWGKPVDKTEWGMTPQTVNAYYNPMANEIVFPAAILQAPFFDPEATDAENYGGIGVVIGHEMTHGFDDQGRIFDADGNLKEWWTAEDAEAFNALAKQLVAQFDSVEIAPGVHANGQYTLGENIADQGGLRVSRTALLNALAKQGIDPKSEEAKVAGMTPEQLFYMNYAYIWANNARDEEKLNLTSSDPHSLAENRVNVTLRNIEPFFEAFGIKEGDKLYRAPEDRVVIW